MLPIGVSACQFWCLCVREQQGYREKTDGLNSPSGFVLTLSPDIFFFFFFTYVYLGEVCCKSITVSVPVGIKKISVYGCGWGLYAWMAALS